MKKIIKATFVLTILFGLFSGIFLVVNGNLDVKSFYENVVEKKDNFLTLKEQDKQTNKPFKKENQEIKNEEQDNREIQEENNKEDNTNENDKKQPAVEQENNQEANKSSNQELKQDTKQEPQAQQNGSYNALVDNILSSVVHIRGVYLVDTNDRFRISIINAFNGEVVPDLKTKSIGSGSGFFVSNDGYIVTNHHVIKDIQEIDVETNNGNKYKAKLMAYDESSDLAVLKIEPKKDSKGIAEKFNVVKFGNSDNVNVGDQVIVVGGPYGNKWSVSSGIVSAKSREDFRENSVGEFIQVDAAVNPGNSGGPLFNVRGEVIGVNTFGYRGAEGLNFAISQKTVSEVLPELSKGKTIARGLWGITVSELEPWDVKALKLKKNKGMIIQDVSYLSPAYNAGLKRGDVIIEVNGMPIVDNASIINVNKQVMVDTLSTIKVNRYGKIKVFKNVPAVSLKDAEKLSKGEIGIQEYKDKGMNLRLITSSMHTRFRLPKQVNGVVVTSISDIDPSFMLQVGDIIMQINEFKVNSIEDYKRITKQLRKNKNDMAMFHIFRPTLNGTLVLGSKF